MNVYNDILIDKKHKLNWKIVVWMDQIGLCSCYILEYISFNLSPILLLQIGQYQNKMYILWREYLIFDLSKMR